MKIPTKLVLSLVALGAITMPSTVFGHAISIGYVNAGAGSVTIWLGTYGHGGHHLEGSLNLVGVGGNPFPSTTVAFTTLTGTGVGFKPAGLVDGVSNFYTDWNGSVPNNLPLVGTEANFNAGCPACGPVDHWQGVTFTGLGAGSYQFTYVPIAFPTQEWTPMSSQMNGIFDLSGVVNPPSPSPAPDAGSSLAILAVGIGALSFLRRKVLNS